MSDRADPRHLQCDPQPDHDREQPGRDRGDAAHVARDVGVFLGLAHGERDGAAHGRTAIRSPLLPVAVQGVRFPNYQETFGWRAIGTRDDKIDGRDVTTVFYEREGERVSYSIVAGDALAEPDGRDIQAEGTRLRRIGARNAVTWRRLNHTCVMDGSSGVPLKTVAELAAWKGKGAVSF